MKQRASSLTTARTIALALREDIGRGDITSRLCVPATARGEGYLTAKSAGVLCGMHVAADVFRAVDPSVKITNALKDGTLLRPGMVIARVRGPLRSLLTAERTALNFLQHLSGIATATRDYVNAVKGTGAVILDTRKTTPMMRDLAKYAVRTGGARNHRARLDDMVLIKDNHIAAAGGIAPAVLRCTTKRAKGLLIEVETTTLAQVQEVLAIGGVDRIMLDNYTLPRIRAAVKLVNHRIPLEVSGGVNLKTVRALAKTGVEYISVGAITHSAPALDISFEVG